MSQISLKSISGITSITTPAGVDNQLTLHTNDTTQRVKITQSGIDVTGVVTATSFSGSGANLTSLPAANLTGALPAISGANLTGIDATALKDSAGNVKVQAEASGAVVSGIVTATGRVGVGTNTTTERNALTGVKAGHLIMNATTNLLEYYNGTSWTPIDTPPSVQFL